MGSNRFRIDMPQYIEWYLAGKLKLDDMISRRIKLKRGQRRLRGAEERVSRPQRDHVRRLIVVVREQEKAPLGAFFVFGDRSRSRFDR